MMDVCAAIQRRFADTLGISTAAFGRTTVERIVSRAVKRTGAVDSETYLKLLAASPEEMERCLEELVIPETWFFRDAEPFILLQQYLGQQWFPAHPGQTVRILSLPCSTGEEPYSIAITLLEAGIPPGRFRLDAADVSHHALAAARLADYGKGAFRKPLTPSQEAFFSATPRGRKVDDAVVRTVHFRRENITDPNLLAGSRPYDVIFCRNILIYLTPEARKRVLANLDRLLAADGMLFTGHAEMGIFQQHGYETVRHPRAFACRRAVKPASLVLTEDASAIRPRIGPGSETRLRPAPAKPERRRVEIPPPADDGFTPSTGDGAGSLAPQGTPSAVCGLHAEAMALADRGCCDDAEALCRRYLQEQPPNADVYCLLGLIHEAARRPADAEACYLKALYLVPDHYETLVHLSLLYRQQGDGRRASLCRRRAEAAERRPDGTFGS